ncbi:hypothetical protein D9M72_566350 [compost metagenome]
MVKQPAAGPQQVVELGDVTGDLLAADVFGHADGADRIERSVVHVAVVLDPDVHAICQARVGHALARQPCLFIRKCYANDVHAEALGRVKREAAPAAADVQYAHAGLQPQFAADQVDFGFLGGLEAVGLVIICVRFLVPDSARVDH